MSRKKFKISHRKLFKEIWDRMIWQINKHNGQIHFNRKFDLCPMVFGGSRIGIIGRRKSWNQRILAIFLFGIIICPRHIHVDFEDHFDSFANFRHTKKYNFYSFAYFVFAFLVVSFDYCSIGYLICVCKTLSP